jgi:hypothetical protein
MFAAVRRRLCYPLPTTIGRSRLQLLKQKSSHPERSSQAPKRGVKSKLPPRVPIARRRPRLAGVDFCSPAICRALGLAEKNHSESNCEIQRDDDQSPMLEVLREHDLSKHLKEVVADYCADRFHQVSPADFRAHLHSFDDGLQRFLKVFPDLTGGRILSPGSGSLAEALEIELAKEETSDLYEVGRVLQHLQEATERLLSREQGPGKDGDRAGHLLIKGLAIIFEEYSGKKAKAYWIDRSAAHEDPVRGEFPEFIRAVFATAKSADVELPALQPLETYLRAMD